MVRCDLESSCYIKRHSTKVCTKFERNGAIPSWSNINNASIAHVMWRCDLDLWPLDLKLLQHFGCQVFKHFAKFERNRLIHCSFIDDLASFRSAILGGASTQLHQTWRWNKIMAIINALQVVSEFTYLAAFLDTRSSNRVMLKTTPNFSLFGPTVNRGGLRCPSASTAF